MREHHMNIDDDIYFGNEGRGGMAGGGSQGKKRMSRTSCLPANLTLLFFPLVKKYFHNILYLNMNKSSDASQSKIKN